MPTGDCGSDAHLVEYLYLVAGLVIGTVLGLIIVSFAAIGSYERGYRDARGIRPGSL